MAKAVYKAHGLYAAAEGLVHKRCLNFIEI